MFWQRLKEKNINYDELNTQERETLENWLKAVQGSEITPDKVKAYIEQMKDSVAQELAIDELPSNRDLFLKARLRNYLLMLAFLTTPEKAKKALEEAINRLPTK